MPPPSRRPPDRAFLNAQRTLPWGGGGEGANLCRLHPPLLIICHPPTANPSPTQRPVQHNNLTPASEPMSLNALTPPFLSCHALSSVTPSPWVGGPGPPLGLQKSPRPLSPAERGRVGGQVCVPTGWPPNGRAIPTTGTPPPPFLPFPPPPKVPDVSVLRDGERPPRLLLPPLPRRRGRPHAQGPTPFQTICICGVAVEKLIGSWEGRTPQPPFSYIIFFQPYFFILKVFISIQFAQSYFFSRFPHTFGPDQLSRAEAALVLLNSIGPRTQLHRTLPSVPDAAPDPRLRTRPPPLPRSSPWQQGLP